MLFPNVLQLSTDNLQPPSAAFSFGARMLRGRGRARAFTASAAAASGPPVSAGKLLWLDADDAASMTLSGSNVTSWTNKAGAGEVFTVGAGTPIVDAVVFPKNSVRLGTGAAVSYMTNATGVAIPENSTVFMVLYWANVAQNTMALALHKGTSTAAVTTAGGRPIWMAYTGSNGSAVGSAQQSTTVYKETTTGLQAKGARGLWVFRTPDPNTAGTIRLDGVNRSLAAGGSTDVPLGMVVNTIGSSDSTYLSQGYLAELIVYDSVLSDGNTTSTEAYLKAKWGTP
jgi:hypothetical protein